MAIKLEKMSETPHVALVTIDRPEKANSLNPEHIYELASVWKELASDREVRCVVLTGSGERVFCAGMDMRETVPAARRLVEGKTLDPKTFEGLKNVSIALLAGFDLKKPLICAINGHARAGGFDLMLSSELRVSVPEATFALEEVALGLYPTGNATVLLPRQIGWANAHEILLTAKPFSAERALEIGLINRLAVREKLLDSAFALATAISQNGPLAVRETRFGVRELLGMALKSAYKRQEEIGRPLRARQDAKEGQLSFLEKRPPVFKGL